MIAGYIGVGIVIGITLFFVSNMINDLRKKILKMSKYEVDFKKLLIKSGMPIIPLSINGKYELFLLDTGSSENILSKKYYDSMDNKPEIIGDNVTLNGSGGQSSTSSILLNIKCFKSEFNNEQFLILDSYVFDKISKNAECNVIGVIGSPFFNEYKWTIDFDESVVWVNKK